MVVPQRVVPHRSPSGSPNEDVFSGPNNSLPQSDHSWHTRACCSCLAIERSFTKTANWLWDMLPQHPSLCDWAIYTYLYRLSIGNQTSCMVSRSTIQKSLGLGRNTVIGLSRSQKRGFITEV